MLESAFGPGLREQPVATGWAPGRCTIVGEHVDYAGGAVVCAALDRGVEVALRRSPDGVWRAVSAGRAVQRVDPAPVHDIGDRIFAAAQILGRIGIAPAAVEVGVSSTLPEGAGLGSSAAIACAVILAALRLRGVRVTSEQLVGLALGAERGIVGVPVGALDPRAIVECGSGGALLLDFATGAREQLTWPWDGILLVVCDSGQRHDVGGAGYRSRRDECAGVMQRLGVVNCQQIDESALAGADLSDIERRRARHLAGETRRSRLAAAALRSGDAEALGRLMTESHASLAADFDVVTDLTDRIAAAAARTAGVFGARMVGAGFGGAVVALCAEPQATRCEAAMAAASGGGTSAAWSFRPGPGLAELASDVIART